MPATNVPVTPAALREDPAEVEYPALDLYPDEDTTIYPTRTLVGSGQVKTIPVTPA